jgi:hypothetical protein
MEGPLQNDQGCIAKGLAFNLRAKWWRRARTGRAGRIATWREQPVWLQLCYAV